VWLGRDTCFSGQQARYLPVDKALQPCVSNLKSRSLFFELTGRPDIVWILDGSTGHSHDVWQSSYTLRTHLISWHRHPVTSCNTCMMFADQLRLVPSYCCTTCYTHMNQICPSPILNGGLDPKFVEPDWSPVQSSGSEQNRTYGLVQGSEARGYHWTRSDLYKPM